MDKAKFPDGQTERLKIVSHLSLWSLRKSKFLIFNIVGISIGEKKKNSGPKTEPVETDTTGQKWQQKIPKLESKTRIKAEHPALLQKQNGFYDLGTMLDGITWNNMSRNMCTWLERDI